MSIRSGSSRSGRGSGMGSGSDSSRSSPTSDLPSSSFDGSHLPWKSFRSEVLVPHRVRILEAPPKEHIPASFLSLVDAGSRDNLRFEDQKICFWNQVTTGRGFGPSPLFPPNLLPPIDLEPRLARCMVPLFNREALPERAINQMGPLYELSDPRPTLGCGFSSTAFTIKELATLPQWLQSSGTVVNFDTGYISPTAALYCPFLTFERAYGNREHRVESANNQCAIGGAFTARALQMLYVKAWKGQMMPELPVTFSCTIDNSFAVLNFHWIDHGQAYCMAPLCQFDLSKDVHFSKFLVWTQAISDWALAHVLPLVKEALSRLQTSDPAPQIKLNDNQPIKLRVDTGISHNELLMSSLKTTFENIPWRYEDEECTPGSSSTASWGSPLVNENTFSNLNYPVIHPPRTTTTLSAAALQRRRLVATGRSPVTPPPAYPQNADLVWQKRFTQAMDEIRELQQQLVGLKGDLSQSQNTFQADMRNELSQIKGLPTQPSPTSSTKAPSSPQSEQIVSIATTTPPTTAPAQTSYTTLLQCTAVMLIGHILASFIPSITLRFLTFGVITNACLLTFITPTSLPLSISNLALPSLTFSWPSKNNA